MKNAGNSILEPVDFDIFWGTYLQNPSPFPRFASSLTYD